MAELGEAHPDVRFDVIDNTVTYTVGNYESAMHTLIEGAVLAVIVVFIFLRDWRATLIAVDRAAAVGASDILGHERDGLLAQPREPSRASRS